MSNFSPSAEQKTLLRRQFRQHRLSIDSAQKALKDTKICEQLKSFTQESHKAIHIFLPIIDEAEIDLRPYIDALPSSVEIYSTPPPTKALCPKRLVQQYDLSEMITFELIIVPMLSYDPASKHRLGYGGGFYDRLLALQPAAQKVGVCYEEFATTLPYEPHDQPLDLIITA
jgi:5-formyltetrahydrofolate cyclo-ligase